eukprot:XP_003728452.1 PREDICTED: tRNA methyltransferase 10 homolog A isoform X1 [Strongylocentrotus purpuratus]
MEGKVDCEDDTNPEAEALETEVMPTLSKNQLKKQLRLQRWAETKKERRKKEKEKIKEKKRKMLEEARQQGLDEESLGVKKRKMSDPEASNIRVAVDCAYDSLMVESDIKKLIKQIQRCYSENRKANKPLQFYVSNLKDKTKQILDDVIEGYQKWDIHFREEEPETTFGADNIVYLAAESPNVLQDLDPNKVYIIGGLVDHNHHKGYCYEKVLEQGWSHAQLPIGDFVKLNSRKVLAVNHVYEIILAYIQLGNWKDAFFQVLPNRKVEKFLSKNNSAHDDVSKSSSNLNEASVDEQDQSASKEEDSVVNARQEEENHSVDDRTSEEDGDSDVDQRLEKDLQKDVISSVENTSGTCTRSENLINQSDAKEFHSEKLDFDKKPTVGVDECGDKDALS